MVPRGYDDYREMIDTEKPMWSTSAPPTPPIMRWPCTPWSGASPWCARRPLTKTLEEARALAAYAKEHNIITGVNFNCRWYPQVMQAKAMVDSGEVGDIYTVHGGYLQDWLYYDTDYSWRLEPEVSGDSRAFADIGSHWIDMVESVTGLRAVEVLADFETFHKTRKKPLKPVDTYSGMALRPEDYAEIPIHTEDYCTVLFRFDNGAHGACTISQVFAGRRTRSSWTSAAAGAPFTGTARTATSLDRSQRRLQPEGPQGPLHPQRPGRRLYQLSGGHVEGFPDTFKQNFKAIYAAIEQGDSGKGILPTLTTACGKWSCATPWCAAPGNAAGSKSTGKERAYVSNCNSGRLVWRRPAGGHPGVRPLRR